MLGSFKFKLVAAFIALALLPLAAAYWSFSEISDRSVTSSVDARLEAGLRAALAAFEDERSEVEAGAEELARDPAFQEALAKRDRAALGRRLADRPTLRLEAPDGFRLGRRQPLAAETTVSIVGPGTRTATIVAAVPVDAALVRRLHDRSGLDDPDALAIVLGDGRVGPTSRAGVAGRVRLPQGRIGNALLGGDRYRVVGVRLIQRPELSLAALTPSASIAADQRSVRNKLLGGLVASLVLIGIVAYLAGRSIVGALARLSRAANSIAAGRLHERVPVRGRDEFAALGRAFNQMAAELEARLADLEDERRRLRGANARFGVALAATLDPEQLRRVIVESAVEATNAEGGLLRAGDGSVVAVGDVEAGPHRLQLELTVGRSSYGTLILVGREFDQEASITAAALAGQAVIALDNARLHRIVERQALVDELTGLANRRQAEERLVAELGRAGRLGGSVGLILADLDDFKAVNDRYGHPTGDAALREFATTLRESVRDFDVAVRWGGEEFAVLLPATDADGATHVAERVRTALAERPFTSLDGEPIRLRASFGVAASAPGTSVDELVEWADDALYQAKRTGKDRVCVAAGPVTRAG